MMQRLGERKSPELRARLLFEMNQRIAQLEQGPTMPWFLQKVWSFQLAEGQQAVALPSDFLREMEEGRCIVRADGALLGESKKVAYEDLSLDVGPPTQYALFGESFYSSPADRIYDCTLDYYGATLPVADNEAVVTNSWLIFAFNFVSLYTLRLVAQFHVQNAELAARFDLELRDAADRFWRLVEGRQHANREYKIED